MSIFTKPSTRIVAGAAATVTAFGLFLSGGSAANAANDPATNTVGAHVAVGSDTLQDAYGALATPTGTYNLDSFKAFPAGNITLSHSGGSYTIPRPAGSGDGVAALSATYNPGNHVYKGVTISNPVIDIARSSSTPSGSLTWPDTNSKLVYVPFARDAVSLATYRFSAKTNFAKETITAIYAATTQANAYDRAPVGASDGDVKVVVSGSSKQVQVHDGAAWVNVDPKLPQASSGTRSFFQKAIGVTDAQLGTWVVSGFDENDAGTSVFPVPSSTGNAIVIPFSAAQYVAQRNGKAPTFNGSTQAEVRLASIDGKAGATKTGSVYAPGALFDGDTSGKPTGFSRDVYSVVLKSSFGTSATPVITDNTLGALVSKTFPASTQVTDYGFKSLGTAYTTDAANWKYSNWTN